MRGAPNGETGSDEARPARQCRPARGIEGGAARAWPVAGRSGRRTRPAIQSPDIRLASSGIPRRWSARHCRRPVP